MTDWNWANRESRNINTLSDYDDDEVVDYDGNGITDWQSGSPNTEWSSRN